MDPLYIYNENPNKYGGNLVGFIACTWSELIDNNNFYNTIVPSIYLLSRKWDNISINEYREIPKILYDMCQKFGYPIGNDFEHTWKRRKWVSFFSKDNPRGVNSVDTNITLDREHDKYPVFSKFLINLLYNLYLLWIKKETIDINYYKCEVEKIIRENFANNYDVSWLFDNDNKQIKEKIKELLIVMKTGDNSYYNNGLVSILRYLLHNIVH